MNQPSVIRLNLLRACYALMFVGLGIVILPQALFGAADLPIQTGATNAILAALGLTCGFGIIAPLRMLPLLVFEVAWKLLWCLFVALPLWATGRFDTEAADILFACAFALPFIAIIPWRYTIASLVRPEPWRPGAQVKAQ